MDKFMANTSLPTSHLVVVTEVHPSRPTIKRAGEEEQEMVKIAI